MRRLLSGSACWWHREVRGGGVGIHLGETYLTLTCAKAAARFSHPRRVGENHMRAYLSLVLPLRIDPVFVATGALLNAPFFPLASAPTPRP